MQLNILVALSCEAAPIIKLYKLGKVDGPYPYYQGDSCCNGSSSSSFSISLLVCGIGKLNMASAIGWLAGRQRSSVAAWLNVGTAGHESLALGLIGRVARVTDSQISKPYYPPLTARWQGEVISLLSGDVVVSEYPQGEAVDMEASAFFKIANRFSTAELVQSLKVISDNESFDVGKMNSQHLSAVIEGQLEAIANFCEQLMTCMGAAISASGAVYFGDYCAHLRSTQSQRLQLSDGLQKLINLGVSEQGLQQLCSESSNAKFLIAQLNEKSRTLAPRLDALKPNRRADV